MAINLGNLIRRLDRAEVEEMFSRDAYRPPRPDWMPIANPSQEWRELAAQLMAGDELWEYARGGDLAFESGVAAKRGDRIVGHVAILCS